MARTLPERHSAGAPGGMGGKFRATPGAGSASRHAAQQLRRHAELVAESLRPDLPDGWVRPLSWNQIERSDGSPVTPGDDLVVPELLDRGVRLVCRDVAHQADPTPPRSMTREWEEAQRRIRHDDPETADRSIRAANALERWARQHRPEPDREIVYAVSADRGRFDALAEVWTAEQPDGNVTLEIRPVDANAGRVPSPDTWEAIRVAVERRAEPLADAYGYRGVTARWGGWAEPHWTHSRRAYTVNDPRSLAFGEQSRYDPREREPSAGDHARMVWDDARKEVVDAAVGGLAGVAAAGAGTLAREVAKGTPEVLQTASESSYGNGSRDAFTSLAVKQVLGPAGGPVNVARKAVRRARWWQRRSAEADRLAVTDGE